MNIDKQNTILIAVRLDVSLTNIIYSYLFER